MELLLEIWFSVASRHRADDDLLRHKHSDNLSRRRRRLLACLHATCSTHKRLFEIFVARVRQKTSSSSYSLSRCVFVRMRIFVCERSECSRKIGIFSVLFPGVRRKVANFCGVFRYCLCAGCALRRI